jgi:hypothetical protein
MAAQVQIPLSYVINVTVLPTPQNLGIPNVNTIGLITQDQPSGWGPSEAYRIYTSPDAVATDFGSGTQTYAMAIAIFSQQPNPVGTNGYLAIIPRLTSPSLESIHDAIERTKDVVFYFGVIIDQELGGSPAIFAALTAYLQTLDKLIFYCSSNIADLDPGSILDNVRTAGETHTRTMYYGQQPSAANVPWVFAAAYAGRALTTDFSGSLTATTMHLKQLATITPDQTLTETAVNKAQTAGVDVYPSIASVPGLFTSGANDFFDNQYNEFWMKFALQVAGFNFLATTSSKIPQTEPGMTGLKDAYRQVLRQAVLNGVLAPGAWTAPTTFGNQAALLANVNDNGFYIFSAPVTQQSQADRLARKAPLVQIAAKLAGAIHSSNVIVNVNA